MITTNKRTISISDDASIMEIKHIFPCGQQNMFPIFTLMAVT